MHTFDVVQLIDVVFGLRPYVESWWPRGCFVVLDSIKGYHCNEMRAVFVAHFIYSQDADTVPTPHIKLSIAPNGIIITEHDPTDEAKIEVFFILIV